MGRLARWLELTGRRELTVVDGDVIVRGVSRFTFTNGELDLFTTGKRMVSSSDSLLLLLLLLLPLVLIIELRLPGVVIPLLVLLVLLVLVLLLLLLLLLLELTLLLLSPVLRARSRLVLLLFVGLYSTRRGRIINMDLHTSLHKYY